MKRISIRARVTLWYTGLLVVLLGLGVVYLLSFSDQMLLRQTRDALLDVVSDAVKQAHFDDGELDDEKIDFYSEGVSVFFYDTSGRLLAPRVNRGLQVDSILEDQAVKTVSNGRETWMVHDLFAIQDGTGFWVRGVVSLSGSTATVHGMILLALIGVPIFIAVAALGGWLITRRAFFPVGKMAETAQAISSGSDLSLRVPDDGSGDELSRLGCTINSMLARLQASFETERQFSSDASHELRTPTAVIISQCEYALSDAVDEAERRESLGVVLRQARRMSAIISQLLLLARAENGKFEPSWERLNLSELCEMVLLEMEDTAQSQGIALEMQLEAATMLEMATIGGARALRLDDKIGSLDVGKLADIIAVDLSGSHQTPTTDPVSAVVNTCSGADILMTMVNGVALYEKNKWNVGVEVAKNIARVIEIRGKLRL